MWTENASWVRFIVNEALELLFWNYIMLGYTTEEALAMAAAQLEKEEEEAKA